MNSLDLCNSIRMEFEGVIENKIPLDVFPAKLQDMVLALARQENYSIEYTMASLIAAASTAIGNAVNIRIRGGWVSSPILYMILVGRPGMGKTPPLDFAFRPIRKRDAKIIKQFKIDMENYNSILESQKGKKDDRPSLPPKPILKRTIISDFTPEALIRALNDNPRGVAVYVDEIMGMFNAVNQYSKGQLIEQLLTAFSGYGDSRRCYASLLLPACNKSKYAWEWLRTLVIFPVAMLTLIWFVDELAVKWMLPAQPMLTEISDNAGPLWDFVAAVGEPLNYIPYNIYLVVWFNAAAMLVRSGLRPAVAVVAAVAALAMVLTFQWSSVRATLYPFVWVEMEYGDAVTWSMPVTWCSRMTGYAISYVWYATLPLAIYVLSYLKFKEREI